MKFQPKKSSDFSAMNLLPEGEYPFQVMNAADDVSKKSGKEMIVLDLVVFAPDGANRKVRDYLVPSTPYGEKKIYEFAKSVGILAMYESGTFTAQDCVEKTGYAKISIDKGKENPKGGMYPDKNAVKWYTVKAGGVPTPEIKADMAAAKAVVAAVDGPDDSVPF